MFSQRSFPLLRRWLAQVGSSAPVCLKGSNRVASAPATFTKRVRVAFIRAGALTRAGWPLWLPSRYEGHTLLTSYLLLREYWPSNTCSEG